MPHPTFEQVRDYLHAVQIMEAQGITRVDGSLLKEKDGNSALVSQDKEEITSELPVITTEEDPDFTITPSKVYIHASRPDRYRFSFRSERPVSVSVEGNFNNWGLTKHQKWSMDTGTEGNPEFLIDTSDYEDGLYYRFVADKKKIPDPKIETISFLPGVGACSRADIRDSHLISFEVMLRRQWFEKKKERKRKAKTATNFLVKSHPPWLIPLAKKVHMRIHRPIKLEFRLNLSQNLGLQNEGKVLFVDASDEEMRVELPVELIIGADSIYAELKEKDITLDRNVAWGEEIEFVLPVITKGSGTINMVFFGNGVAQEERLTADNPFGTEHSLLLRVDTSKISRLQAKNLKVHILSDSRLANRRHLEFGLHFNLVRLSTFPIYRLDWSDIPWGSQQTQVVEFYRSDTLEPVENIEIVIPENLTGILRGKPVENTPNGVRFSFDSRRMKLEDQFNEDLHIKAVCKDGLELTHAIPSQIRAVATDSSIKLHQKKWCGSEEHDCVWIVFENRGPCSMEIFNIEWERDNLLHFKTIYERGKRKWPIVPANQELRLSFELKKNARWFWPRKISDVVRVNCNSKNGLLFTKEIKLMQLPRIISALRSLRIRAVSFWRNPSGSVQRISG
jgi:hypothetical protein